MALCFLFTSSTFSASDSIKPRISSTCQESETQKGALDLLRSRKHLWLTWQMLWRPQIWKFFQVHPASVIISPCKTGRLLFIPCLILTQISRSGLFVLQTDKWARKSFPSNPLLPPTYLTDTRVLSTANKWKWMPLTQSLSTLTKTDPWSASYSFPPLKSTEVQDWYSTPSPLAYTSCCLAASCAVSGSRWQLEDQRVTSVSDFINLYFHLSPSNCWSFSPPLHLLCYRPAYPHVISVISLHISLAWLFNSNSTFPLSVFTALLQSWDFLFSAPVIICQLSL